MFKIKNHFTLGSDDSYEKTDGTVSTLRLFPFALLVSSLGPLTELDDVLLNTGAEAGAGELEEVVPLTVGGPLFSSSNGVEVCPAEALLGTFANGSTAFKRGCEEAEDGEVRTRDPGEDRKEEDREEEDREEEDREEEDREEEDREEEDREEDDREEDDREEEDREEEDRDEKDGDEAEE